MLSADLSSNAMGRVLVLARVLARFADVEVIGPTIGRPLWAPIAEEALDVRPVEVDESPRSIPRMLGLTGLATGDVLYACKPVWSSFGMALRARARRPRPLVLDIDDWEWGFSKHAIRVARNKPRYLAAAILHPHLPNAWPSALYFDRQTHHADAVTVSNSVLQSHYGGDIVWHGRDTALFDPARYPDDTRRAIRRQLGFAPEERVVMYFGTIQPYKGVDDLIRAVAGLGRDNVRLALVGAGESEAARAAADLARATLGARATVLGPQPFERVPGFLAAADVVAVPQRRTDATSRQMPAKLFDAMAMARPVVATAVCDIPRALDGCGWVVEPEDPDALGRAIGEALDDPARAGAAAAAARRRCVEEFSFDAMERTLCGVFERAAHARAGR
jgi:glycosyltransferase involved in cell wall biosynthesis